MVQVVRNPFKRLRTWVQARVVDQFLLRRAAKRTYSIVGGHIYFQTLNAAVELDLFTVLDEHGQLTLEQIAEALGCSIQPVRILVLGCLSLGLITRRNGAYRNTWLSGQLFLRKSRRNIIDIVRWQHHINYKAMYHFADAIRANANVGLTEFPGTGDTLYERLARDKARENIFQLAMRSISVQANRFLSDNLDLSAARHLLDVGGGDGSNVITLAKQFPQLHATVFDSATVCKIAMKSFEAAGLAARLRAVAGDCFSDPFPKDVDAILLAHFLTIWSPSENCHLLKKCYDSLSDGGCVIVFNMMQSDAEDGPLSAAMGSPYFLTIATGRGMLYTWREYERWLRQAGFDALVRVALPKDHGLLIGRKAAARVTARARAAGA
jgi:ubiquinone/menaquinone biosynthesis C-methylase UbiE